MCKHCWTYKTEIERDIGQKIKCFFVPTHNIFICHKCGKEKEVLIKNDES